VKAPLSSVSAYLECPQCSGCRTAAIGTVAAKTGLSAPGPKPAIHRRYSNFCS
jgi:hypothetical protein